MKNTWVKFANHLLARFFFLDHYYSFVKELLKSMICWTHQRERVIIICKSVQVFSPLRKTTWKSLWKTLIFLQEKTISEKKSNDNLDQLLNIDNLPKMASMSKLFSKPALEMSSWELSVMSGLNVWRSKYVINTCMQQLTLH